MTEIIEPVAPPALPDAHDDTCPFCNPKDDDTPRKSVIGAENDASKLEGSLESNGEPRADTGFFHEDYGAFSAEPHHLVPGNEAMKGHPIEKLLKKGSTVKADTGFDINHYRNGIWLPSIPDANRICNWETKTRVVKGKKKVKRVPAASEKNKTRWSQLSEEEKDLVAFAIMQQEQLQFHKSNHLNRGKKPSQCYIKEAKRLLDELLEYALAFTDLECPKSTGAKKPMPPPLGLNELIYGVACGHMRWHVVGPAESWFVFISKLAQRLHQYVIEEKGAVPWDIPYPNHPDRT